MAARELIVTILAMEGVLYSLVVLTAGRRRSFQEHDTRWFMLYSLAACLWTLAQALGQLNRLDPVSSAVLARLPHYGLPLLAWLFLHLTRSFLRLGRTGWGWWAAGAAWLLPALAMDANLLPLDGGWTLRRETLMWGILLAGWAIFTGAAAWLTLRTYRLSQQPLHRNRITYWLLAGVFIAAGDILFFSGLRLMGGGLHAAGALITAYVVVTHRLPDVRQAVRRSLSYLIITLVTMSLYTAGFMAMQYAFQAVPGYSPLLAGAAMSLILAVLFQPLLGLTERMVNQLLSGIAYDSSQTLHQYSTNISNILDLELLANLMVKLIGEALKIRHGQLFLVDQHTEPDGSRGFRLRQIGSQVAREVPEGGSGDADKKDRAETRLAGESPIAEYLRREPDPLTQYDVDLLPRYQAVGAEERAWFSGLRSDVYVPIHAKGEWIGLLALGPKLSGDRYFDEDLVLLRTLADQTAVALENARLVEDLIHAHNELGQAYAALARANRQLQELDKLKSAFIGVITHELRTPFANITFSLELLQRHGRKHLPVELSEQLDQLTAGVKSARTMVDNLVTFATFLSKQGELRPGEMDFRQVVEDSLAPLTPLAESKGIGLHAELPETLPSLCGDRERLADAMYHLVHNALKFTNAGGQVWVRCRAVNHSLRFEVEDTGKGVPADKLPDLWEGFTQMADPLRRGVEGLGLGLALVKYVVNAHGGQVWADSQEGAGSTFGFQIPLAGPAGALPQLPPSPAAMPPGLLP